MKRVASVVSDEAGAAGTAVPAVVSVVELVGGPLLMLKRYRASRLAFQPICPT